MHLHLHYLIIAAALRSLGRSMNFLPGADS